MPNTKTERPKIESNPPAATDEHAVCQGFGACSKSGCNCQGFEGGGGTCGNRGCGHAYEDHW